MGPFSNPFIYGRAVTSTEFLGREPELRRLFSRLTTGQSTAIIDQPHIGKTSLLKYVLDDPTRTVKFGIQFKQDLFNYLDAQTLRGVKTQASFWESALTPLADALKAGQAAQLKSLVAVYALAQKNKFGTFVLEQLFTSLHAAGSRLVLLLDEFDDFLSHSVLNSAEFYGSLRSLASRSAGLVLVIAARKDLEQLNQLTQAINPHGSPYFNVFTEIRLGAFSKKDLTALLDRAGDRFNQQDRKYVSEASGGHPYLAQAAAATLWEAYDEDHEGAALYESAGRALYQQTKLHFADTWRSWTNETRKVVTAVALAQIPQLLGKREFLVSELIEDLHDYSPELEVLETSGLLIEDKDEEYFITQGAFLWWPADELRRNVRDDTEFKTWLQAQELDSVFTNQEKQKLGNAAKRILSVVGKGTTTLIEAFAKGYGEGMGKGLTGGAKG
jgi:hypothetical protein